MVGYTAIVALRVTWAERPQTSEGGASLPMQLFIRLACWLDSHNTSLRPQMAGWQRISFCFVPFQEARSRNSSKA